jgi:4-alpha-glucanotransferase
VKLQKPPWFTFRDYAAKTGVKIIGDMPFYVGYDSADMWSNPQLFKLDKNKKPQYVGGVPPDYFSSTGQLWGAPVYNWRTLQKTCFNWWINRINNKLRLYDVLRLDHFRGFIAYWQVPAGEKTARNGQWIRAPTKSFFDAVQGAFPSMPFIAEDLGSITKNVYDVISQLQLPGMRVLIFAFNGSQSNPHLPDNYTQNTVVYTGTHDTNTVKGWFVEETTTKIKQQISSYIGRQVSKDNISIELIKLALSSRANLSIIPLQDVLGLGAEARMNHPAKQTGNWVWRVTSQQLTSKKLEKIGELTTEFNRS